MSEVREAREEELPYDDGEPFIFNHEYKEEVAAFKQSCIDHPPRKHDAYSQAACDLLDSSIIIHGNVQAELRRLYQENNLLRSMVQCQTNEMQNMKAMIECLRNEMQDMKGMREQFVVKRKRVTEELKAILE